MTNRKAFFSVAIPPAVALLAGTVVLAAGPRATPVLSAAAQAPGLSSCRVGDYEFTVSSGPTFVPCKSGQCTEIEYKVSLSPEVVYALEGTGVVEVSNGGTAFAPCDGVGSFGKGSCHEQAVRTAPDDSGKFKITLAGQRLPSPTSVAISTDPPQACEILGLGLENSPSPDQTTQTTERVDFKGCVVEFTRDASTGEVVSAVLTRDSPDNCNAPFLGPGREVIPQPVTDLEVKLEDGTSLGKGKFGEGYISTGSNSCTTRVIGGKVYTWGSPCP